MKTVRAVATMKDTNSMARSMGLEGCIIRMEGTTKGSGKIIK